VSKLIAGRRCWPTASSPVATAAAGAAVQVVAARTVEVDLPAQTTLDQASVALLKLRRGDVPGDATLDQSAFGRRRGGCIDRRRTPT
jgi:hypothetical protein